MQGLEQIRVIDFTTGIAGAYCTKLFVDAGAEVIKVEAAHGDPLRHQAYETDLNNERGGALFRFLNAGKRSVQASIDDREVLDLIASADLVVEQGTDGIDVNRLRLEDPQLVILSLTPFGRSGDYSKRPYSEFTLQAEAGSTALRGHADQEPYHAGGRISEWVSGAYAAAAGLAAVYRALRTGEGEAVDLSMLETINLASTTFLELIFRLIGFTEFPWPARSMETPSIEPSADGWVGFNTNSGQQFHDFLTLIERTDLHADTELANVAQRMGRHQEWQAIVREWTERHSTAHIVETAALFRIPVAPVLDGKTVLQHEHFKAREIFVGDAEATFQHPRRPYRLDGEALPAARLAPQLGEDNGRISTRQRQAPSEPSEQGSKPFAGLRIIDMTNWWAGPASTQLFASLGADVIHIESTKRPDGVRFTGGILKGSVEQWWECSAFFLSVDSNKRSLTLDLSTERGRELLEQLLAGADLLVDNYSPRVLEGFGFTWERLQQINPRLSFVRMPAFGLDGPWRDHVGFAQTMDQISGLAWVTGHENDQPRIQRGPCDPLAGMTAAFAAMVALLRRRQTGRGSHVECPMVEGALNAAAEQVIAYTAYGQIMQRAGNRSHLAAPQGLYTCQGHCPEAEQWLALTVASDEQWRALRQILGDPHWAEASALDDLTGRLEKHDLIDDHLRKFLATKSLSEIRDQLLAAGIAAAAVEDPRRSSEHPAMKARGFYETMEHPVAGTHPIPTLPFRYQSIDRWTQSPAPTLGQHNHEILSQLLGLSENEILELKRAAIIGTKPDGL